MMTSMGISTFFGTFSNRASRERGHFGAIEWEHPASGPGILGLLPCSCRPMVHAPLGWPKIGQGEPRNKRKKGEAGRRWLETLLALPGFPPGGLTDLHSFCRIPWIGALQSIFFGHFISTDQARRKTPKLPSRLKGAVRLAFVLSRAPESCAAPIFCKAPRPPENPRFLRASTIRHLFSRPPTI